MDDFRIMTPPSLYGASGSGEGIYKKCESQTNNREN